MTRQELIKAVKVKIEEFSPFESISNSGLEIINSTQIVEDSIRPIQSYIDELLDESAYDVLSVVPLGLIRSDGGNVKSFSTSDVTKKDGVGYIDLSVAKYADFVRIFTISLPKWYRSIHESITPQTNPILYEHQGNPFLRGKVVNPVVAIANGGLELYSIDDTTLTTSNSMLNYVAATKAEDVQDDLQPLVVMQTAIKLCEIYNRNESVKLLSDELQSMMQGRVSTLSVTKVNEK